MEQKIQQLDAPTNYLSPQHATNGFSHSPSVAQIAAYCIISASIAVYFSCTHVLYTSAILLFLYCLFGFVMILSAARATLANPTDRVVYSYKWSLQDNRMAFKVDLDQVLFCLHCDSYCLTTSKHCRVCNRCVSNFDHHCMWFNNCVGDRNYPSFFISLLATLAYAINFIVHTAFATFQVDFGDSAQLLKIVLSWVIAVIMAIFAFLLGNLIILHIYLWATNQTTYQFLQRKKKEEAEALKIKQNQEAKQTASIAQLVPERTKDKHVDIHSEDSYANTKIVTVHPTAKPTEETPQKQPRNMSEAFQQFERCTKVHDGEDLAKNVQDHAEEMIRVGMDSHEHLPQFLRKNKSLNIILAQSDAVSPQKQKKERIGSLEQIKG